MRKLGYALSIISLVVLLSAWSCGQNGPTPPTVSLSWTQCIPPAGAPITVNNVYRCTGTSCTPAPPALFTSTAPITSYSDTSVARGSSYVYAVTCSTSAAESGYSNTVGAGVPSEPGGITPPVEGTPKEASLRKPAWGNLKAVVRTGL
ncbi:MAG: hypothetical protein ACLPLR_08750 [Terriglobales bacterium]